MPNKIVQTELSPEEHALLVDYATQHNLTIEEITKQAILAFIRSGTVNPADSYFGLTVKSLHPDERGSQDPDSLIYRRTDLE